MVTEGRGCEAPHAWIRDLASLPFVRREVAAEVTPWSD